jgi:hypothetical protein
VLLPCPCCPSILNKALPCVRCVLRGERIPLFLGASARELVSFWVASLCLLRPRKNTRSRKKHRHMALQEIAESGCRDPAVPQSPISLSGLRLGSPRIGGQGAKTRHAWHAQCHVEALGQVLLAWGQGHRCRRFREVGFLRVLRRHALAFLSCFSRFSWLNS